MDIRICKIINTYFYSSIKPKTKPKDTKGEPQARKVLLAPVHPTTCVYFLFRMILYAFQHTTIIGDGRASIYLDDRLRNVCNARAGTLETSTGVAGKTHRIYHLND